MVIHTAYVKGLPRSPSCRLPGAARHTLETVGNAEELAKKAEELAKKAKELAHTNAALLSVVQVGPGQVHGLHSQHDGSHCAHVACSTRSGRPDPLGCFYAVILFGQVWVASNVLLGIHMFQRHSRKLRRDLANAMLAIQEAKATQDVSNLWTTASRRLATFARTSTSGSIRDFRSLCRTCVWSKWDIRSRVHTQPVLGERLPGGRVAARYL